MNAIHSENLWQKLLAESVSPTVPTPRTPQDRRSHYARGELELVRELISRWLAEHASAHERPVRLTRRGSMPAATATSSGIP